MVQVFTPFQPTLTEEGLQRFGLCCETSQPRGVLKGKVFAFLQLSASKPTPYPVMPDGTQAVYFSSRGVRIGGAQLSANDIAILEPGEYFGIWFYPGALRHFFELDVSDITGQYVDDAYFSCPEFTKLYDDLYDHHTFRERVALCESWLLSKCVPQRKSQFDVAMQNIYQSGGGMRVHDVADVSGCSTRQLNRQFLCYTGVPTKVFSQIVRVQNACRQLYLNKASSLPSEAQESGFFDQSHQIREFKKYLLATPGRFFDRFTSDLYNH